ncbi:MAG TPA: VOC family protein [Candidatus Omnitrophota bacterium]|mgnify:CR=1 FL=1|nr:VOC family protein [Candidatus Omnitrophota bacterium]
MKRLTPQMCVDDVIETVTFYSDVFGFKFIMGVETGSREIAVSWREEQPLDWAIMNCGDVEIMFQSRAYLKTHLPQCSLSAQSDKAVLYIEMEDLRDFYTILKGKVEVIKDIAVTFYGMREFYVRDCNGYIIGFAEKAG